MTLQDLATDLMTRLVRHYQAGTTDLADQQWHEPVRNYGDPAIFQREIERVHRRVPLPLAMSREIGEPGSYKALDVAGVPVVITRDEDGTAHAMVNACRHRGAQVVQEGVGTAKRLNCPYHAWSYDLSGCLRGVYGEKTFGPVDRESRSLIPLPVQERAGIVFVGLTPGARLDVDEWLGDMLPTLETLRLNDTHHHASASFTGPNWKLVVDGFLESYHFAPLHRDTVFQTALSNIATFDAFGRHLRYAYARRQIADAAKSADVDPSSCSGPVTWVFPGLSIAGGLRNHTVVSLVLPGRRIGESSTHQTLLLRTPPATEVEVKEADQICDYFRDVLLAEDYPVCAGIERGLDALAGTDFVFGRNEPAVQHFHRVLDELMRS